MVGHEHAFGWNWAGGLQFCVEDAEHAPRRVLQPTRALGKRRSIDPRLDHEEECEAGKRQLKSHPESSSHYPQRMLQRAYHLWFVANFPGATSSSNRYASHLGGLGREDPG
jgi:hypothetical protein